MYEKHSGDFLLGNAQNKELVERVQNRKFMYGVANKSVYGNGTTMPEDEVREQKAIAKRYLKEEIATMAVLKRADKRRYGNLQISLRIHICWEEIIIQTPYPTCYRC